MWTVLAIPLLVTATADIPQPAPERIGRAEALPTLPIGITPPTLEAVLGALPNANPPRKNVRLVTEVVRLRKGPSRLYPIVGKARLVQVRFRCTVISNLGREIVFVDADFLGRTVTP